MVVCLRGAMMCRQHLCLVAELNALGLYGVFGSGRRPFCAPTRAASFIVLIGAYCHEACLHVCRVALLRRLAGGDRKGAQGPPAKSMTFARQAASTT